MGMMIDRFGAAIAESPVVTDVTDVTDTAAPTGLTPPTEKPFLLDGYMGQFNLGLVDWLDRPLFVREVLDSVWIVHAQGVPNTDLIHYIGYSAEFRKLAVGEPVPPYQWGMRCITTKDAEGKEVEIDAVQAIEMPFPAKQLLAQASAADVNAITQSPATFNRKERREMARAAHRAGQD